MIELTYTVDSKPLYKRDEQSFQIIDLLKGDYTKSGAKRLNGIDLYMATNEDAMRPDIITKKVFGYMQPLEMFLKFNQVSNPFAIDEGDIFVHYDILSMRENIAKNNDQNQRRQDVRSQYITPEKKSTVDPRYQDFAKRKEAPKPDPSKGNNPALPPNYANFGDQEIELRNGKLVFGAGVSKAGQEDQGAISKSEFIAKIIKNRIKNQ